MFLTELQEKLRDVQTERGNVPLSRAHVMHDNTVLIAHSDIPDEESGDAPAEAENQHSTYVTIPRAEYDQLLEFRDELKASYQITDAAKIDDREHCNLIDVNKGACTLKPGHPGDHVFANPEALPTNEQIEKDNGWPAGSVTEVDGKLIARCIKVSDTRGQCKLDPEHDGDHDWALPVPINALRETMEATAAKLPPDPLEPSKSENIQGPAAAAEVDAMAKHEANQAALAADAAAREKQQPETLQE